MENKNPPFEITEKILESIIKIGELVGNLKSSEKLLSTPQLRKSNRIKTIHSSLAIEQNTLDIAQVTAIISGKRVIAPEQDIKEVRNAHKAYEFLMTYNPYSVEELLKAHQIMMKNLAEDAGEFRQRNVGVADEKGNILHVGTIPQYVPELINKLLDWVENSSIHMLIKSCVFHYEFELIHPFSDGNGRIGRLWHTLLLTKWNPMFAWIPIESVIYQNQQLYYDAINRSNAIGNSTPFIEFMLSVIIKALQESTDLQEKSLSSNSKIDMQFEKIKKFLDSNVYITNSDVQALFNVSTATATRILTGLKERGSIKKIRLGSKWAYTKN